MNIFNIIKNKKDKDIEKIIKKRLSELKNNEEITIGYNSDIYLYNGFLDDNVRLNFSCVEGENENENIFLFGGMVFNDEKMFSYLVDEVKKNDNPYLAVFNAVDNYLSLKDKDRDINAFHKFNENLIKYAIVEDKLLSINLFHKNRNSECAQIAGVTHNMLKFLGLDSDLAIGNHHDGLHSYNILYPWGRENDAILFDATRPYTSRPFMFLLDNNQKSKLYSNEMIYVNNDDAKKAYKELLDYDLTITNSINEYYTLFNGSCSIKNSEDLLPSSKKEVLVFRRIDKN